MFVVVYVTVCFLLYDGRNRKGTHLTEMEMTMFSELGHPLE